MDIGRDKRSGMNRLLLDIGRDERSGMNRLLLLKILLNIKITMIEVEYSPGSCLYSCVSYGIFL